MTATLTPYQPTRLATEGMTLAEWRAAGIAAQQMAASALWWVGDWYLYGERTFGHSSAQEIAAEAGYKVGTVQNAAWVCERIDPSRRRESLSFSHHAEVASLPMDEQEAWLDLAQEANWTRAELRRQMGRMDALLNPDHKHRWRCVCGDEITEGE